MISAVKDVLYSSNIPFFKKEDARKKKYTPVPYEDAVINRSHSSYHEAKYAVLGVCVFYFLMRKVFRMDFLKLREMKRQVILRDGTKIKKI